MSDQRTIEDAIVSTIQLHADFDSTNCKANDRRILGKGLARVVVVHYNTHRRIPGGLTLKLDQRIWSFNIDVLVPWRGQLAEMDERIGTETQKVIDTLAEYPRLNGTTDIQRTDLTLSNTPDILSEKKGGYRGRRHNLDVLEIYNPQRSE
jgi:hypothetical protein